MKRCARCTLPPENSELVICELCCADVGEAVELDALQTDMNLARQLHVVTDPFSARVYHIGRRP